MPDVSDAALAKVKKKLLSLNKNWTGGVCEGAWFELNGDVGGGEGYGACHAWVSQAFMAQCFPPYKPGGYGFYGYEKKPEAKPGNKLWYNVNAGYNQQYRDDAKTIIIGTCHSKQRSKNVCSEEAHEELILWLASKDNPLSEFVLNRDDRDSLLNAGLIILCGPGGATCAQAMWMCKVLRYAVEGAKAVDVWFKLKQGGVDPLLALLVATHVRTIKGATFGFTGPEAHSTVFSRNVKTDIPRLMQRVPNLHATCTSDVFIEQKGAKETPLPFQKFLKPTKKSDGWGGTVDGVAWDQDEFVRQVLKWQEEMTGKAVEIPPPPPPPVEVWKPSRNTEFLELDM